MLDNKDLEIRKTMDKKFMGIIKKNVENLTKEEKIMISKKDRGKFTSFFLENSGKSFDSAKVLMEVSNNQKIKKPFVYRTLKGVVCSLVFGFSERNTQ